MGYGRSQTDRYVLTSEQPDWMELHAKQNFKISFCNAFVRTYWYQEAIKSGLVGHVVNEIVKLLLCGKNN